MIITHITVDQVLDRLKYPYNPPLIVDEVFEKEWWNCHDKMADVLTELGQVGNGLDDEDDFTIGGQCLRSRAFGVQLLSSHLFNGKLIFCIQRTILTFPCDYEAYITSPYLIDNILIDVFVNKTEVLIQCSTSQYSIITSQIVGRI